MAAAPAPLHCWAEGCAALSTSACARCRTAEYCGEPCQRSHWRAHKPRCKELEAAADAAEAAAEAAAAAAPAAGGGGASEGKPPSAPRTPGVYTGLECRVQDYHCALVGCGTALEPSGATNAVCSGCRSAVYCDVKCQTAHWAAHKEACYEAVCDRVCSGDVHQDDEGGEYVLRDMLCLCKDEFGVVDERTLHCINVLGLLMQLQGKLAEAGALYKECYAATRTALGPKHKDTLVSMSYLAELLQAQGNLVEAVPLMREALDTARATLGKQYDSTLTYMTSLAGMLETQGKFSEAEALYREALEVRWATQGTRHQDTTMLLTNLGVLLKEQGRLVEAEELLLRAF